MYGFESDYFLRMRCDSMEKRWHIQETDDASILDLADRAGISSVLAQILYNRGIRTNEEIRRYLYDDMDDLDDPFLMKGMKKAVERICRAIEEQEKIVIYGDYDVDGITSTALVYSVLRDLGGCPSFYIPERQSEGYGLNADALQVLQDDGTHVLITVDCGISSHDLIEQFNQFMDIIVTDHHMPPQLIPDAYAVINPKQEGCPYPFKDLAGAGVAFKLCQALWQKRNGKTLPGYVELCALGTIADLVPLRGENRILVKEGLKRMKKGLNTGVQALLTSSGLTPDTITAGRIAFTAAPRLNAAGRISHATRGVEVLLESDAGKATSLADELSELNKERQDIEHTIAEQAVNQIEEKGQSQDGVLVAYGNDWHSGVIGIAASRLVEKFYRPALVISIHDGIGKGSCRSIPGFNMYEALKSADDLLIQYGGHTMAAGFSIVPDKIESFRQRLLAYAADHMTEESYIPEVVIDKELQADDISLQLIQELSALEPYGMGNSRPVFALRDAVISECRPIGRNKHHLRLSIETERQRLGAVGWSMASCCANVLEGDTVDLAFTLEPNEYNGIVSPQMVLQDIHRQPQTIQLDRNVMVDIYMALKHCIPEGGLPVWQVQQRLIDAVHSRYEAHTACAAMSVLREIGVLDVRELPDGPIYYFPALTGKMHLEASATYGKYFRSEGGR